MPPIPAALAGKRIAITGSTGLVGTALVERLLRSVPDCELVLLVRDGKRTPAARRVERELLKNDAFNRLRAELAGGSESFEEMAARRITTISGDVVLKNLTARYVRGKSTSGDIQYDGDIDSTGRYELGSHSGSVYLTVPATVGAQITVATYTGSIDSEFPITLRAGEHAVGAGKRFTFDIGKGDARISAESFSGDITIRTRSARSPRDR